jgi:hypothetical protein
MRDIPHPPHYLISISTDNLHHHTLLGGVKFL